MPVAIGVTVRPARFDQVCGSGAFHDDVQAVRATMSAIFIRNICFGGGDVVDKSAAMPRLAAAGIANCLAR